MAHAIACAAAVLGTNAGSLVLAADNVWDGSSDTHWGTAANWSAGHSPGSTETVVFDSSSIANLTTELRGDYTIVGLKLSSPSGNVSLENGNSHRTLSIGAAGIDLANASHNLSLNLSDVTVSSDQSWTTNGSQVLAVGSKVANGNQLTIAGTGGTSISGVISGIGGLTKSGAGTLTMSGANTYTGATSINAGTVVVGNGGSLAAGSAVTVANGNGATLAGNGTVSGSVTVNGTIAPTDATGAVGTIGKLTTGAESWNSGGTYAVDMNKAVAGGLPTTTAGTDQDYLVMSGLTVSGGFTIQPITGSGFSAGFAPTTSNPIYEWVIANVTSGGSITGLLSGVNFDTSLFSTTYPKQSYHFSLFSQAGSGGSQDIVLKYNYNAVPEATTLLLGIAGLAPILLHRRRRKQWASSTGDGFH